MEPLEFLHGTEITDFVAARLKSLSESHSILTIGHITRFMEPVNGTLGLADALQVLSSREDITSLPVEGDRGVAGLIHKRDLLKKKTAFTNPPVEKLLDQSGFHLEAEETCEKAMEKILARDPERLFDDFMIYRRGRYFGIGTFVDLSRNLAEIRNADLDRARTMQEFLMTRHSADRPGLAVRTYVRMAHEVGGDNLQCMELNDTLSLLSSYDVCGKGTAAALLTSMVSSFFSMALLLGIALALSITRPVARSVAFAERIAGGDLTQHLDIRRHDEIGTLGKALNNMSDRLAEMVGRVKENAESLALSSGQIFGSAQMLAEGAQSQASSLEETTASMEELDASVAQVAEHAQSQAAAAQQGTSSMAAALGTIEVVSKELDDISALARKSVDNAVEGAKAVTSVVEGISAIASSSEKIGGIVTVISDIADQTNLLALNASIEAARAGENGRGFAVVADEVSKLADRSASSTKEIEKLIRESIKSVTSGVETARNTEKAMEQIRDASRQVNGMISKVSESMTAQVASIKELAKVLQNISDMSQNISLSVHEQTTNARQVSLAVEGVNKITQSTAAAAEQMSSATEQLSGMAQDLRTLIGQFHTNGGPILEAASPPAQLSDLGPAEGVAP